MDPPTPPLLACVTAKIEIQDIFNGESKAKETN